jgi:hypothetical protein
MDGFGVWIGGALRDAPPILLQATSCHTEKAGDPFAGGLPALEKNFAAENSKYGALP